MIHPYPRPSTKAKKIALVPLLCLSAATLYGVEETILLETYTVPTVDSSSTLSSETGLTEWYEDDAWAAWNPDDAVNLLEFFPNITINEPNPGSDESLISIRDNSQVSNGRTWVLLDGFPLSNIVNTGAQGAPRLNVVDPQSLASLEVLYGPTLPNMAAMHWEVSSAMKPNPSKSDLAA